MTNKIPLDPNGVQPGYKVVKDARLPKIGEFVTQGRYHNNIRFFSFPRKSNADTFTIAIFRLKPKLNV